MSAISIQQIDASIIQAGIITAGAITARQIAAGAILSFGEGEHEFDLSEVAPPYATMHCGRCGVAYEEIYLYGHEIRPCISALEAAARAAYELTSGGDAEAVT